MSTYPISFQGKQYTPDGAIIAPAAPIHCEYCGRECIADELTPGYGYVIDSKDLPRRACYDCCARDELQTMYNTGRAALYLDENKGTVSNWTGRLTFRASVRKGRHNWRGCVRYDVWFYIPGDAHQWHGVCITGGVNMIANCKQTKGF